MTRQEMDFDGWQTIPELFAAQAAARPDAAAVSFRGEEISYGELAAAANGVASWLLRHRIGLEDVVGVQVERSPELVSVLLGVLTAGAVYLPLEATMPPSRQRQMMRQAGAAALISADDPPLDWTESEPPVLRLLDGLPPAGPAVRPAAVPESLAYLSFTSGSTGRPKPVGVPHRAVARLAAGGFVALDASESVLAMSSLAFDASTFEIWGCLLNGGRLVILPPGPLDAQELAETLDEGGVTTAWLTAGLFHRMVEHHLDALGGLRQLIAGGDVLNPDLVNRFRARHPDIRLVNGYGPTENTTFTACHRISGPMGGSVPIGRAIEGTGIRVLDEHLTPVRDGQRGELYATGAGLSRGYIGMPALTALRFVPDPYAARPGGRMYRTGDLVRALPGGELDFCGRLDRQVKIRGYRIEPEEIERQVATVPGVGQTAVVPRTDRAGEKNLVTFVSAAAGGDDQPGLLLARVRRHLRHQLPGPMMPSAFVLVDDFPLTSSNKIDTGALSAPSRTPRQADTDYVAPRSATERIVADMWAEHLDLDRVGVHDDFFDLGGNSLLAMDLISQMELVFDVSLPIRGLLFHPNVAEFAHTIDAASDGGERR